MSRCIDCAKMVATKPGKIEASSIEFEPSTGQFVLAGTFDRNCAVCDLRMRTGKFRIDNVFSPDIMKNIVVQFGEDADVTAHFGPLEPVDDLETYTPTRGKNKGKKMPLAYIYGVSVLVSLYARSKTSKDAGQDPEFIARITEAYKVTSQKMEE